MPELSLGRLPKKPPELRFPIPWAHELLVAPLPAPVYPIDFTHGPPGDIWGNDSKGDCGECGVLFLELFTAGEAGGALPSWTSPQAIAEYLEFTGGQDTGVVLADFLLWLYRRGRIKGFVPAPHHDRLTCDSLMTATRQPLYCGVNLTANDQADFRVRPWGSEGAFPDPTLGHCVNKVFSDPVTTKSESWRSWAAFQPATLAWGDACLDEAWVVITTEEQAALFTPQLWAILDSLPGAHGAPPAPTPAPPPPPAPVPPVPGPPAPRPPAPVSLSLHALGGAWRMAQTAPSTWTLTQQGVAAVPPSVVPWLTNAAQKVAGAFLLAFLPLIVAAASSDLLSLSTLRAAVIAGIAAAAAALDALIGNAVQPGATGTAHALRARGREAKAALAVYRAQ